MWTEGPAATLAHGEHAAGSPSPRLGVHSVGYLLLYNVCTVLPFYSQYTHSPPTQPTQHALSPLRASSPVPVPRLFPGGAKVQMNARRNGIAYERKATAAGREKALGALVEMAAPVAWDFVMRRYTSIARDMLREVGIYGIYSTGFSKARIRGSHHAHTHLHLCTLLTVLCALCVVQVTIAYDNPTCVHYDSNYGADVILAFRLRVLKGGEHVMLSVDGSEAVVVETSELGVLIGGCHEHLLHGNLGTTDGGRIVLAWYMPQALRNEAPNRFGK